jgi:hypothetical protein
MLYEQQSAVQHWNTLISLMNDEFMKDFVFSWGYIPCASVGAPD